MTAGLVGPGRARRVLDLDPVVFLAFLEALVCESEDGAKEVQAMYDAARPAPEPPPLTRGETRRAEVDRFLAL